MKRFASLKGKVVARALLNPFPDGRGGWAYQPSIVFDDGTIIAFTVQETDVGEYGIQPIFVKPVLTSPIS